MMKSLFALLFAFAAVTAGAQPMEVTAEYIVTNNALTVGRVSESFVRKGDGYTIQSVTRSDGVLKPFLDDQITVESSGRVGEAGLQPLVYVERRLKDSRRDLKLTFDWDKRVMSTLFRGESSGVALPTATQDRISVMYQFMSMRDFGETITIPMAERSKVQLFNYRLVGEAKLATPAGEFDTRHYQRIVTDPTDTKADVWLAKDRFNFPVRLILDNPKGFKLEQNIVDLQTR
jgi:hypothetical protein